MTSRLQKQIEIEISEGCLSAAALIAVSLAFSGSNEPGFSNDFVVDSLNTLHVDHVFLQAQPSQPGIAFLHFRSSGDHSIDMTHKTTSSGSQPLPGSRRFFIATPRPLSA